MPLESIAALLGHRCLSSTMVYARIANRTVQQEYAAVSHQLEKILNQPDKLTIEKNGVAASIAEGEQMRQLRQDHWRMLGNGYCSRPPDVQCDYETICESCPCFSTTVEFLPILHKQREDATNKGQTQRAQIFSQLIQRMKSDQNGLTPENEVPRCFVGVNSTESRLLAGREYAMKSPVLHNTHPSTPLLVQNHIYGSTSYLPGPGCLIFCLDPQHWFSLRLPGSQGRAAARAQRLPLTAQRRRLDCHPGRGSLPPKLSLPTVNSQKYSDGGNLDATDKEGATKNLGNPQDYNPSRAGKRIISGVWQSGYR